MRDYVLSVEATNFGATVYDTNDISVIRGASLQLTELTTFCKTLIGSNGTVIGEGAERVRYRVTTDDPDALQSKIRDALSKGSWRHFCFAVDIAETEAAAEARNRCSQFRQWTVPPPEPGNAIRPDQLDRMRPAVEEDKLKGWLSRASIDRLAYGRTERKRFWSKYLTQDFTPTDSLSELVEQPPEGLAESAKRKIGLIHIDGDGFGKISSSDPVKFNEEFTVFKSLLLRKISSHAMDKAIRSDGDGSLKLRIEALLWGGDDFTFVMPSWEVLDFLTLLYETASDEKLLGKPISFTACAIVAHHKTPIRQLEANAHDAMDVLRADNGHGHFSLDLFESAALPEDGIEAHRKRLFGDGVSPKALAFPAPKCRETGETIEQWHREAGEILPSRSKMYDLLKIREDEELEDALKIYRERVGQGGDLPKLPGERDSLWLDLALISQLWDYVPQRGGAE